MCKQYIMVFPNLRIRKQVTQLKTGKTSEQILHQRRGTNEK